MTRVPFGKFFSGKESRRDAEKRRRRPVRPILEQLDSRILPSIRTYLSQGILSIYADNGPNQVQLIQAGSDVQVRESGQLVDTFPANQVEVALFQHGAGQ